VGGVEALTGILMCGWSTGIFFAVVSRMHSGPGDPTDRSTQYIHEPGGDPNEPLLHDPPHKHLWLS
jgi:hypothetical protein